MSAGTSRGRAGRFCTGGARSARDRDVVLLGRALADASYRAVHPVILDLLDRVSTGEAIAALQAVLAAQAVTDDYETLDDPAFAAKYLP